jgi:ribose transport system permease protein
VRHSLLRETLGPLAALALVALLVALTTRNFLDPGNLSNLVLQVSIVAIVAIGSTVVILTGGIDLSPGSMIALITVLFASAVKLWSVPMPLAMLIAVGVGLALGLMNGLLVAYVRIPSFIVTLAGLSMFRGVAFMFNNGSPVFQVSPWLEPLFYGTVLHVPLPLFYVVGAYAVVFWFLRWTALGRSIYAVGGNANAARLSGIHVRKIQLIAFALAGVAAGIGAVLMAARLNSGSPNYGVGLELSAIAAAVIGGASLSGGRGNLLNTVLGATTIVVVQNGLNLNAVPTSAQNVITGAIILFAVGLDNWRPEIGRLLSLLPTSLSRSIR